MNKTLTFCLDTFLHSYSRIFFTCHRLLGVFVLLATFTLPWVGLWGFVGGIAANLTAYVLGLDRFSLRKGFCGFNGILCGLAIGVLPIPLLQMPFFIVAAAIIAILLTLFFNVILNTSFKHAFGIPSMTLPFTLTLWLVMAVIWVPDAPLFLSTYTQLQLTIHAWFVGISPWIQNFFIALSAVVLQMNPLAGVLIATALFIYSRIALLLVILGYSVGMLCQYILGIDGTQLPYQYLAFNYLLVAWVVGGVMLLPSIGSLLLACVATMLTVFFTVGLAHVLPAAFSPLALPFNVVAWLLLFTLCKNYSAIASITLTLNTDSSPEEKKALYSASQFLALDIALPFDGQWKVTQGVYGSSTHRERHYFAYDFMAVNEENALYQQQGFHLTDYNSYGKLVLAPADGRVVVVCDGIPDNPIGQINAMNNWGNAIIIQHDKHVYSCIAHLQPHSITVTEQQTVSQGDIIGYCGNSGTSRYPHIHLQFQSAPVLGYDTVPFDFSAIFVDEKLIEGGLLTQNTIVQNAKKQHR